jgi:hypothetical protein
VLARLQSLPGISEAYVELTGRHFLLIPESGELAAGTTSVALDVLGTGSGRLDAEREQGEISDFDAGGLWLDCGSLINLSLLEARILAALWGGAAAREAKLNDNVADDVVERLRVELSNEFRTIHGAGGTTDRTWHVVRFRLAFDRCLQHTRSIMTQEQGEVLRESLLRRLD